MFQHILLGVCGTSPVSPGRLVLSVTSAVRQTDQRIGWDMSKCATHVHTT